MRLDGYVVSSVVREGQAGYVSSDDSITFVGYRAFDCVDFTHIPNEQRSSQIIASFECIDARRYKVSGFPGQCPMASG